MKLRKRRKGKKKISNSMQIMKGRKKRKKQGGSCWTILEKKIKETKWGQ